MISEIFNERPKRFEIADDVQNKKVTHSLHNAAAAVGCRGRRPLFGPRFDLDYAADWNFSRRELFSKTVDGNINIM